MQYVLICHDMKTYEVFDNAETMVNRIVELMNEHTIGRRKPTHLAIDETGITIIMDLE